MGLTQKLGTIPLAILTDASNNVGIGAAPSGTYKLEVTGTAKVSSTLLVSGALTGAGEILTSGGQLAFSGSGGAPSTGIGIRYNGTFYVYAGANGFNVRNSANSTNNLTIADSGAATFSSTITSGGTISVNPTSVGFLTLGASANYGSVSSGGGGATLYLNGATRGGTGGATSSCVTLATDSFFQVTDGSTNNAKLYIESSGRTSIYSSSTYCLNVYHTNNVSGIGTFVTSMGSNANNTSSYHYIATTGGADKYYLYGNGTYTTVSDERLKKNISKVTDTYLDKVLGLNIVNYNWNDQEDNSPLEFGMIAQEVEKVIPSIVHEGREQEDGNIYKGIQASVLPYILIKAIQELNQQNQDLKSRLDKAGL